MKNNIIIIDGIEIEINEEKNILKLAKENGIYIPALCFLEDCNNIGQCGVCVVEIEGQERLTRACCIKAKAGMIVNTKSEKVQVEVKNVISGLLDKHDFKCGICKRRENCEFLKLVIKTKAKASKPFIIEEKYKYVDDRSRSIVLDRTKCVTCGRCVATCRSKIGTNAITFQKLDGKRIVGAKELKCFDETNCLLCGQCVAVCPVDALSEKLHIDRVKEALEDKEKHVIVAMAPAVRAAIGELFKMGYGVDVTGKIYTALRNLGFDKIFDINFGADMTIMEEVTEFIQRVKNNGPFPMFTSCCPAWVRQVENYYPELLSNLSSAKSPQQIFGAASKTYYPTISDIDPAKIYTVTIMPCIAKKYEADKEDMQNNGLKNIDAVITTRELAKMIKDAKIDFAELEYSEADSEMGEYTGAGAIFGATGGVMEAALRSANDFLVGEALEKIEYEEVRGIKGIKEATVEIGGHNYNFAVVNGASNLFEFINSGMINRKDYHIVEVMACPGGCVNGGGQPHVSSENRGKIDIRTVRALVLYNQDKNLSKRKSHDNVAMKKMYETYIGEPGYGKAHELLHIKYRK